MMEYVQANSLEAVHLWAAMEAQAGAASAGTVRQLVHVSAVFDRFQLVFIGPLNPKSLKTLNPKTLKATLIIRTHKGISKQFPSERLQIFGLEGYELLSGFRVLRF